MEITPVQEISVTAADGFKLAASLYEPPASNGRAVLINSAMAVKRRFYQKFASFLAQQDFTVLTYDYRGVGGSSPARLRGFAAHLWQWGETDQGAVIGWLSDRYPAHKFLVVGHSVGGQIVGLTPYNSRIAGLFGVAPQSGYWKLWPTWPLKLRMFLLWYAVIPGTVWLLGYFPGSKLGLREDLPAGVVSEWARWTPSRSHP